MAAGLLAKKALEKGLQKKSWVKSSLAPGSKVVTDYLEKAGLQTYLNQLGFYLVGYGCTTCIGNSGPLPESVQQTITDKNLIVCSVLSGNRNFEGRVHPATKANWLASPPLVVALALAGTIRIDLNTEPLGKDQAGNPVFLKDIWPSQIKKSNRPWSKLAKLCLPKNTPMFLLEMPNGWQIPVIEGNTYQWRTDSTYVKNPPFFQDIGLKPAPRSDVLGARVLALFGDSITTDHISPAGNIKADSPAGIYLRAKE